VPAEPARAETDAAHKRLSRARSLAAIGKLAAAAGELEALRGSTKDDSVRDVARVLLVAIFVEMPDYQRALALLEEAYGARAAGQAADSATHSYFAIAGQTVNAVRTHLERYRAFGVNVADSSELTADAVGDLEQLRGLLDRLVEQAKALRAEQSKGGSGGSRGLDAAALLEDAATVRMRIARHDQDRARWQSEISEARQHLFSSEMRIASISQLPAAPVAAVAPPAAAAAQPARSDQKGADAAQKNARKSRPASGEQAAKSTPAAEGQGGAQPAAPAEQRAPGAAPQGRADNSPVSVGSLVGKARQRIAPSYPQLARTARVSGNVTVYLIVNEKGEVESVQRADGPQQLQQAAIDAARRWKFNPTVVDGQTVRVSGFLHFNFTL
jgi:TonB family protein